jgi:hypothetical protein
MIRMSADIVAEPIRHREELHGGLCALQLVVDAVTV